MMGSEIRNRLLKSTEEKIEKLTNKIHGEEYPEEYDAIYDSCLDSKLRRRGENPMAEDYIERVKQKRINQGVSPLGKNGMPTSKDTYNLCYEIAKQKVLSDLSLKRPPSENCVLCTKSIDEVGGKRIYAQSSRGIKLAERNLGGGSKEYPHRCIKLYEDRNILMHYWGEPKKWGQESIDRAKEEFLNGRHPWFCQVCAERYCHQCGKPINYPVGSDVIYDDGEKSHFSMIPVNVGCMNSKCDNYRDLTKKD